MGWTTRDGPPAETDNRNAPTTGGTPAYWVGPTNGPEPTRPTDPLHRARQTELEVQRWQVVPWAMGGLDRTAWTTPTSGRLAPVLITTMQTGAAQRNAPYEGDPPRGNITPTFVNDPVTALYGF